MENKLSSEEIKFLLRINPTILDTIIENGEHKKITAKLYNKTYKRKKVK